MSMKTNKNIEEDDRPSIVVVSPKTQQSLSISWQLSRRPVCEKPSKTGTHSARMELVNDL